MNACLQPLHYRLFASTALCALALSVSSTAAAQTASDQSQAAPQESNEIIVTAQRRNERLQDVPISITSLSSDQLAKANITSTADLGQLTPGLVINQEGTYVKPRIRGVGTVAISPSLENPVALYIDGVYVTGQIASIQSLNNIARVEIDKGPQGTLFGRNATAGLIQITTRDPEFNFNWSANVTGGNYGTVGADAYVTSGLTDRIAADLSVYYSNQTDGFGTNIATGKDVNYTEEFAVRSKWLWTPGPATKIVLKGEYSRTIGAPVLLPAPGTTPFGGASYTGDTQGANSFYNPYSRSETEGVSLRADQDLGFASLVSLTAWRQTKARLNYDSLVPDPVFSATLDKHDENSQLSQEIHLLSPKESKINWLGGVFLYRSIARYDPLSLTSPAEFFPFQGVQVESRVKTESIAAFAQVSVEVLPKTHATIGGRYTIDTRSVGSASNLFFADGSLLPIGGGTGKKTYREPTWRFSLDHKFSRDLMIYASYNRGFKSGGFNDTVPGVPSYEPEKLDAFEIGAKGQAMDGRLTLDLSGFYYDYKNIQTVRYDSTGALIYNGTGAEIYGVDIDLSARILPKLKIYASAELLHARYKSFLGADRSVPVAGGGTTYTKFNDDGLLFDARGNRVALAPEQTFNLGFDYTLPIKAGDLNFSANYSYTGDWFAEPDNRLREAEHDIVNAQISFSPSASSWSIKAWVKNLFDEKYLVTLGSQQNGDFAGYGAPRTFGVTIGKSL